MSSFVEVMSVSVIIGPSVIGLDSNSPVSVSVAVVSDTGVVDALLLVASKNVEELSPAAGLGIDVKSLVQFWTLFYLHH